MLSDEENNVIDLLKNIDKQKCLMLNCPVVKNNIERQLKIIELNRIIRKQSKEIEELKENNELLQENYSSAHKDINWFCENYISKDKIKAKIEEVDYKMIAHQDVREAVKQVLNSLLEKE